MNALKQNLFKAIDFLIRIESGPDAGKAYRLQPPKIIIGRDPKCQITLTDPKVSRQQCAITFTSNVICENLSSKKNTLVNGQPCSKTILKPGDIISFGQTKIKFETRTNAASQPQLGGSSDPSTSKVSEKQDSRKRLRLFLVAIIFLVLALQFLQDAPPKRSSEKLATLSDLAKQVEESKERAALMRESYEEKKKLSKKKYLYNVEKHFISGFRDFQNGRYGRALDSFGTTIATDQHHSRAKRYAKTARKKRTDLIDTHLRDGGKYKNKLMYSRCAAEFEKAIVLINDPNSKKYELAKAQLEECRLLKTGGY